MRPVRKPDDNTSSSSDSETPEYSYMYAVDNKQKHPQTSLAINGQHIKMTIDTGSSIDVIGKTTFASLQDLELKQRNQ